MPNRLYSAFLTFIFLGALVISVGTYFTALSQYPTADQHLTAKRLNAFLKDFRRVKPLNGSLVSQLVVAIPGQFIAKVIGTFYEVNDPIIWTIRYTPFLPFASAQVVVALALMFYLTALVVLLARPDKPDGRMFLFAAIVILNFPMLKAISKVLKYDALSTLFSAIAILLYIGYRQYDGRPPASFFGKFCIAATALFCGLAYLEKDSSIAVVILIFSFEIIAIPFLTADLRSALVRAVRFAAIFGSVFVATTIVFVPKVLLDLRQFPSLFENLQQYFVNIPGAILALLLGLLVLVYFAGPAVARSNWALHVPWSTIVIASLTLVALAIIGLVGSALIFQDNILYEANIPGSGLNADELRAQSIYVSKPLADVSITTLDHSAWVTHIKIFYSMVRATAYTLPEISVLMIIVAIPTFLFLSGRNRHFFGSHATAFILLLLFPVAMLVGYSLADVPFEPKYLVLANLLLVIFGLYPVLIVLGRTGSSVVQGFPAILAVVLVLTTLPAAPSYLGYKNVFRDRNQENAAALDMKHYIWWTWPGWGETAYPIARYLEDNSQGPITVAFDYLAPFYSVPGIKWVRADFGDCQSVDELRSRLAILATHNIDVLIVSKNKSNQNWCLNLILRRMRKAAVFVDVQQGIEYGWLFRFPDVFAAFGRGSVLGSHSRSAAVM